MSEANISISSKIKSNQKYTQKLEATQLRSSNSFPETKIAQNPENSNSNNFYYSKDNKNIWASNEENALNNEDKEPNHKTKQIEDFYNNDENSMIKRIVKNLNNIMDQSEKGDSNHFSKENSESKRSYSMEKQYYSHNRDNNINLINSIGSIGYSNTHLKKYNEISLLNIFNSLYPKEKLPKRSSSMNNSQLHCIYKLSKNKNSINMMKNNKQSNYKSSFCSGNDIQIKKQEEFCYSPDRKVNIKYQKSNNLHLTSTINSSNNRNGENKTNGTTQASTYNIGTLSSNNNNANSNTSNTCNTGNTLSSLINMTPTLYSKSNLKNYLTSSNYNHNHNHNTNNKATNYNKNKAKLKIPTLNKTNINQVNEKSIKDNNHSSSNNNQNNSNSNKLSNPNSFPQDKKQTTRNNDSNLNLFPHNKQNPNSASVPTITINTNINDNKANKANNHRANLDEPIKENDTHQFSNENSSSIKATIELKSKNINSLSKKESHKSIINKDFSNINISSIKSTNSSNEQNNKEHYSKSEECTKSKRSRSYDIIFTKLSKDYIESRLNSDCYSKENNNCTLSDNIAFQKRREIGKKQVILFSINSEENKVLNGINKLMKVINTDINDANTNNNKLNSNFLEIIDNQMNTQIYGSTLWQDAVIRANKEARDESIPSDIYSDSKFFNSSSSNNNMTNSLEQDTYYLNKTMKKTKKKSKENSK